MDFTSWIELGATAVIGGLAIYYLAKIVLKQNVTINNHLDHSAEVQKEDAKSRIKLAKSLEKHSNSIDGLKDLIDKKIK